MLAEGNTAYLSTTVMVEVLCFKLPVKVALLRCGTAQALQRNIHMLHTNESACYTDVPKSDRAWRSGPSTSPCLSVDERGIKHWRAEGNPLLIFKFLCRLKVEIGRMNTWQNQEILNSALFYLSNLFKPCLPSTEFLMKDCRSRIQTEGYGVTRTFSNKWL